MGATGAAMAFSAGTSLLTGYQQSQAQKLTGSYQSMIANTNASMARLAGEETLQEGDIAASRKNLETQQKVGSILASEGASGVAVGSGSAALVRTGAEAIGATDELQIRNNAQRRAFGYQVQASQDTFQGQFAKLTSDVQAKQSLISGGLGAVQGPLSIYGNYLRYSRYGSQGAGGQRMPFPDEA